ncbi:MAG: amidohydrolase family protein [Cyanobacteria bacterium SZAS LIN-2]|nr:amidohydrolase family protein [Cyanobacteria bacterium SZAS LIN-3]MBS1994891.1 amidohydrolase family protein [Cyanobacteria bacterium SZAS LIN-2]
MNYSTSPRFLLTAAWVLPVTGAAIKGGGLIIDRATGQIEAVLKAEDVDVVEKTTDNALSYHLKLPNSVITPGLFNLHTHLDYSNLAHLTDFTGETMFDWLEGLVAQSRSQLGTPEILIQSALAGAQEAALAGTSFVVDSTFMGAAATGLATTGIKGLVGLELFGLDQDKAALLFDMWQERLAKLIGTAGSALTEALAAGRIRLTVAPHAPYTVSPALWLKAGQWARERNLPLTCHLAESDNEANWIRDVDLRLERYLLKVMPPHPDIDQAVFLQTLPWRGASLSPTEHLARHCLLDEGTIAAHCLKTSQTDIGLLASHKVKVALCPRSNVILKNGLPTPAPFLQAGLTVGLGTDSKASSPSLNLLEEGLYLRRQLLANSSTDIGQVPDYQTILRMLTIDGARAVGLQSTTGSLEIGKAADIAAFDLKRPVAEGEDPAAALFEETAGCRLLLIDGKAVVSDGRLV